MDDFLQGFFILTLFVGMMAGAMTAARWHAAFCNARLLAHRYAMLFVSLGYAALCRFLAPLAPRPQTTLRAFSACSQTSRQLRLGLPTESSMNGRARPCENSTTNTANTATEFIF